MKQVRIIEIFIWDCHPKCSKCDTLIDNCTQCIDTRQGEPNCQCATGKINLDISHADCETSLSNKKSIC